MGQYYMAVILKDDKLNVDKYVCGHDYNNGIKLMEHSWIGNNVVARIEHEILNNPKRICWAGDYADANENGETIYNLCESDGLKLPKMDCKRIAKHRYIVNHDKKEFVDLHWRKLPLSSTYTTTKGKIIKYVVHPLPLLTALGNGGGGGDYFSTHGKEYIGTWSRDLISLETIKPEDFTEIQPNFKE